MAQAGGSVDPPAFAALIDFHPDAQFPKGFRGILGIFAERGAQEDDRRILAQGRHEQRPVGQAFGAGQASVNGARQMLRNGDFQLRRIVWEIQGKANG